MKIVMICFLVIIFLPSFFALIYRSSHFFQADKTYHTENTTAFYFLISCAILFAVTGKGIDGFYHNIYSERFNDLLVWFYPFFGKIMLAATPFIMATSLHMWLYDSQAMLNNSQTNTWLYSFMAFNFGFFILCAFFIMAGSIAFPSAFGVARFSYGFSLNSAKFSLSLAVQALLNIGVSSTLYSFDNAFPIICLGIIKLMIGMCFVLQLLSILKKIIVRRPFEGESDE